MLSPIYGNGRSVVETKASGEWGLLVFLPASRTVQNRQVFPEEMLSWVEQFHLT